MPRLKRTLMHLHQADTRRLARLAATLSKTECRRVTMSELVRRVIRQYLSER
jgi:hypothetical protein